MSEDLIGLKRRKEDLSFEGLWNRLLVLQNKLEKGENLAEAEREEFERVQLQVELLRQKTLSNFFQD